MGCFSSSEKHSHAYYAPGEPQKIVSFKPIKRHKPKEELTFVSGQDQKHFQAGDECYLIHAEWLQVWLDFAKGTSFPPAGITNKYLLDNNGDRTKLGLRPKDDFRPVSKVVWEYLFTLYGGGPVVTMVVPAGFTSKQYKKGLWINSTELTDIAIVIYPSADPTPNGYPLVRNPMSLTEQRADSTASSAANIMLSDLGKSKMKEAKALDADINAANSEAAAALLAKDMGKKKMEEARQKEEQQNQAQMEQAANLFGGGLETKLKAEAVEAKAAALEQQRQQAAALFANMGAKSAFKAALAAGNVEETEKAAAKMLKSAWRAKLARREAMEQKMRKMALMEEAMARKLQSKWRSKLAARKVAALKAEKQRLREQGCAIMLQGAWRIRKSRRRAAELKAKKQRLLEEGSALIVQSRWRIKQAQRKISSLREQQAAAEKLRLEKEEEQRRRKAHAIIVLVSFSRKLLARVRLRQKLDALPRILVVELKSAEDINVGDIATSDPFVYLHAESTEVREEYYSGRHSVSLFKTAASSKSTSGRSDSGLGATGADGRPHPVLRASSKVHMVEALDPKLSHTNSLYQSKVIGSTLAPQWNERCMITNVAVDDKIVLTLMDKDTFSNSDFLGQVDLSIARYYDRMLAGEEIDVPGFPIGDYKYQPHDENGKGLCNSSTDTPGKGLIFFSMKLLSNTYNNTGWVQKQAKALIGTGTYKTRYMMLCENVFYYYENAHSMHNPRGTLAAADISAVRYRPDKSGNMTLELVPAKGGEVWFVHWMPQESKVVIHTWLRKIQLACKAYAPINNDLHFDALKV